MDTCLLKAVNAYVQYVSDHWVQIRLPSILILVDTRELLNEPLLGGQFYVYGNLGGSSSQVRIRAFHLEPLQCQAMSTTYRVAILVKINFSKKRALGFPKLFNFDIRSPTSTHFLQSKDKSFLSRSDIVVICFPITREVHDLTTALDNRRFSGS